MKSSPIINLDENGGGTFLTSRSTSHLPTTVTSRTFVLAIYNTHVALKQQIPSVAGKQPSLLFTTRSTTAAIEEGCHRCHSSLVVALQRVFVRLWWGFYHRNCCVNQGKGNSSSPRRYSRQSTDGPSAHHRIQAPFTLPDPC